MSRYDIEKFDPPPDPDLVCCICQCVLDKAVECPCRHVFCQICIERWLSNRHTCPTCRKRTRKTDLKPVLPLVQNMLNRLMMICDYRDNGCMDKIMLENFERHVKMCGYEKKTCRFSKCGQSILHMYLETHENEECPHREILCEGECGLMIPLSESSAHNCVTALKAHIEEKNRMIEQLKVKLHELNNLSQSLNDQLVELRQQLSDRRNRLFSEDMSDISESDITDYMSDELSPDSEFHDSWLDGQDGASNASRDTADANGNNDAATNDAAVNNPTDQDNNVVNATAGSDVVQQVERTVVSSLFELSSRLERVRNQMRAVLNSGLVQDASTLNDEVRIPSAALDAIVNNTNNANNQNVNNENNNNNYNTRNLDESRNNNHDDENNNDSNDDASRSRNHEVPDSDADIISENSIGTSDRYTDNRTPDRWTNSVYSYTSPDSLDGSWISGYHYSTSTRTSSVVDDHNSDANHSYASHRNEDQSDRNEYTPTHVILSQPPDSPSDTTGSFSSIPTTWSVRSSPAASRDSNHDDHEASSTQHEDNESVAASSPSASRRRPVSPNYAPSGAASSMSASPRRPVSPNYAPSSTSPDTSGRSHTSSRSSNHSARSSSQQSYDQLTHVRTLSPARSNSTLDLSSHDVKYSASNMVSNWLKSREKMMNATGKTSMGKVSPRYFDGNSFALDYNDSSEEGDAVGGHNTSDSENETRHEERHSHFSEAEVIHGSPTNENLDAENDLKHETTANESIGLSDAMEGMNYVHHDDQSSEHSEHVTQDEPETTKKLVPYKTLGSDSNTPVVISTATDSSDSSESESLKYLTKRRRQTPNHTEYGENSGTRETTPADDNKNEENQQNLYRESENEPAAYKKGSENKSSNKKRKIESDENKSSSRKRKNESDINSIEGKRSCSIGTSSGYLTGSTSRFSPSTDSGIVPDSNTSDNSSADRYGVRTWFYDGAVNFGGNGNKNSSSKSNVAKQSASATATVQHASRVSPSRHGSHMSPSRHRSSWRDSSHRRNRSSAGKRTPSQSNVVTADKNGQSLNVKIDLSLINYSGHLNAESANSSVPTATVVHGSANISPLNSTTSTSSRRETNRAYARQHVSENNKTTSDKTDSGSHHSQRTRSGQDQKHDSRLSASSAAASKSINSSNNSSAHRDFPNSWRDESESSEDVLESGSGNSGTDKDDGFESDSSYEVAVPKSTAALLEEYASDESDESWTVAMG